MSFKAIIFFLLLSTVATAQESNSNDSLKQLLPGKLTTELIDQKDQFNKPSNQNIQIYCKPREFNLNVLYIVNGKQINTTELIKIHPATIQSIDVMNPADAIKKYGPTAKDGVIIIQTASFNGAWMRTEGNTEQVLLIVDGYYTQTNYSKAQKQFLDTRGGVFTSDNQSFNMLVEFDTKNKEQIGKTISYNYSINKNELTIIENGIQSVYKKIDDANAPLAGVWAITGRMQDGKLVQIQRTGTRKTLKILTGTRFQWAAIDPGQQSFSGTGGGSYDFKEGKYTEYIEFFSRDSSRVGASLSFEGKIENGDWHHSGLSSKGDKIYEVWSKIK